MEPLVEKVRLGMDTDSEISPKMFVEREVVHQIQILVAPEASTAVEGNGRSAASVVAQCNPVEVANLAEHLVEAEVVQMIPPRDRDYTAEAVSDDGWLRTRVDEEYPGACTGLDVHNRRTRVGVDTENEDRDIGIEEENVSVSRRVMEIGLIEDWAASVAPESDEAEGPFVEEPDWKDSGAVPVEPGGMGEGDADTVVEGHIEDWSAEGMKKMEVVAGKMDVVVAAAAVDFATIGGKTVDAVTVKSVEPQLGPEIVGNAATHRGVGQGLLEYLEQSFPERNPPRAVENLYFR